MRGRVLYLIKFPLQGLGGMGSIGVPLLEDGRWKEDYKEMSDRV